MLSGHPGAPHSIKALYLFIGVGGVGASFPAGISAGEGVNWVGDWGAVPSSGSGDLSCVGEASKQASKRVEVVL